MAMQERETADLNDGCPVWAERLIVRICELEIRLGNVAPQKEQLEANIVALYDRLSGNGTADEDESAVESLFREVAMGLAREGFEFDDVASFINARIPSGRLPYCSAAEVREAITN